MNSAGAEWATGQCLAPVWSWPPSLALKSSHQFPYIMSFLHSYCQQALTSCFENSKESLVCFDLYLVQSVDSDILVQKQAVTYVDEFQKKVKGELLCRS